MSYTRGEKERRIMEKSGILKNKLFCISRNFCRNVRDGSRTGCEQAVGAVFQLVADRVDDHHRNDHDRNGAWKYLWRKKCGPVAGPGQTVPQNTDRCDLDRTDTGRRKIHYPWNIGTADLYRQQQFPHYCRICGMYGDFVFPLFYSAQ